MILFFLLKRILNHHKIEPYAIKSRKFFDDMIKFAIDEGASGLGYIQFTEDGEAKGPIAKFLSTNQLEELKKSAKISTKDHSILFTDKENILFARMLLINNNWLDKDLLLRQVWNYHESSESNTVGTHLYNLKQKLPQGMMELNNSACRLLIKKMV